MAGRGSSDGGESPAAMELLGLWLKWGGRAAIVLLGLLVVAVVAGLVVSSILMKDF